MGDGCQRIVVIKGVLSKDNQESGMLRLETTRTSWDSLGATASLALRLISALPSPED